MAERTYKYRQEITQMMYVSGETAEPSLETTGLIEDIVRQQVVELLRNSTDLAARRGHRAITINDLIFQIRHDQPKVSRLRTFLSWKDVRKNVKDSDDKGGGDDIAADEAVAPPVDEAAKKNKKAKVGMPWDPSSFFSQEVPERDDEDDEEEEELNHLTLQRLRKADERTKAMTKEEYVTWSEYRQASFTYRKGKRFQDDIARPSAAQRLCQYLRAPWYEPDLFNNFARNQEEPIMNDHPNSPADTAADDDMTAARNALLSKLPMELVDQVMDHAEYWGSSKLGFSESVIVSNTTNGNGTKIVLRSAPIGLRTTDLPDQYWNQMPPPQPVMPNDKLQSPRAFNQLLSTTPPSGSHPVRKVVFTLRSRDQGWASHRREPGSSEYSSSWTWFDVGLERFSETDCLEKQKNGTCPHDQLPTYFGETFTACRLRTVLPLRLQDQEEDGTALDIPDSPGSKYNIQRNRQANSEAKTHIITWRADDNEPLGSEADVDADWKGSGRGTLTGDWVRSLQVGDVITVWAKARFGGWRNIISEVSVEVFWAV